MRKLGVYAVAVGLTTAVAGAAPTLWLAGIAMVPIGFVAMSFMITGNTMLQLTSVPQARGRVMALYGVVFLGSTPIGAPLVGWLGQHAGPRADFFVAGSVAVAVGAVVLLARRRALPQTQANSGVVTRNGSAIASR
jgi:MFS family permease